MLNVRKLSRRSKVAMWVLGILSLPIPLAQAQTYKWVDNVQIDQLEPASGGWVWVRLKSGTINCADVGGPSGNVHLMLTPIDRISYVEGAFDRIFSAMLAAQAAHQNVALQITGNSTGQYCIIERIRVKSI